MRMIKALVAVVLISVFLVVLLFSAASLITQAQTTATDVNVTNIKAVYKTVWYQQQIYGGVNSQMYSSWGRGRMHLLMQAEGLVESQTMAFRVYAPLYNIEKTTYMTLLVNEFVLDSSKGYWNSQCVSLDVPNAQFYFGVTGPASGAYAYLSYYLSV